MIKINLLPFRAARKRENIRRQITIYALVVVLSVSVIGYYFIMLTSKVSDLKEEEKKVTAELATFKKELDEIKLLDNKIKEIRTKLNVIKELEKGKTGPILLLSEIADAVPKDKLWLKSLKESKGSLSLTGTAMDNETVSLFMENLKKKEHITTVDLQSAVLREIQQYRLKVSDFAITCTTYAHK
ncbi:PilN domain-containing protein [Thermodesulfobacteriota bacterium]